jgi:hypothetical protein
MPYPRRSLDYSRPRRSTSGTPSRFHSLPNIRFRFYRLTARQPASSIGNTCKAVGKQGNTRYVRRLHRARLRSVRLLLVPD